MSMPLTIIIERGKNGYWSHVVEFGDLRVRLFDSLLWGNPALDPEQKGLGEHDFPALPGDPSEKAFKIVERFPAWIRTVLTYEQLESGLREHEKRFQGKGLTPNDRDTSDVRAACRLMKSYIDDGYDVRAILLLGFS